MRNGINLDPITWPRLRFERRVDKDFSMNDADAPQVRQGSIVEHVRRLLEGADGVCRQRALPFVTLTYAQSIDGCIARFEGETLQLSNPLAHKLTHQVRALHDAILVGINTVLSDDPRLTVRLVKGKNPQPVVVDSRLRFPLQAMLLKEASVRPMIIAGDGACAKKERRLVDAGAQVIRVATHVDDGLVDLAAGLRRLKQLGLRSIMIEGGARIITSVLTCGLADQLLLTVSPRFVGGLRAVNVPDEFATDRFPRLHNLHYQWLAADLILRGDLASSGIAGRAELIASHAADRSPGQGDSRSSEGVDR